MAITDLTNTKWVLNSSLGQRMPSGTYFDDPGDGDVTEYYDINFISNNRIFNLLVFNDTETVALGVRTANLQYGTTDVWKYQNSVWSNQAYRTIKITGGNDVTNANLISWLEANATQVEITYKTFDLSTLQLADGTHTIQVKARATGFKDSNFSNSVNYVVASGFNLIAGQNGFNTGYNEFLGSGNALEYSLDNGLTWQAFNKNFAANETILTGITQIKFRISNAPMTHGADYYNISSTKLNLDMAINGSDAVTTITSNNFVLTQDIDDLYGVSFVD